ncbi:MAG: FAD-dependent oxidoreductase [Betaproteobacteria bacterium]|nr:FAD-dependent oxidoreductase [Betaproteobacteria bacterium]
MLKTHSNPHFPYRRSPDQDSGEPTRHAVVIVGAGPVGLTLAIDLAQRGVSVVLLDDDDTVSVGSRAVCHAKRSLEILDRLGCGDEVVRRGVSWSVGKVFFHDRQIYAFNLLPEAGHHRPAFVNLQQYYFEELLLDRVSELPGIDLRWRHGVSEVVAADAGARLTVNTPDGEYQLDCDWLIACDGAKSPVRHALGLESRGQVFRDRFLIADVLMKADYPTERWFWFDPPFHPGQSTLLHRQADNVWRIDFQLGWDADPEVEKQPEKVLPRLKQMLGTREFDLEWVSVYTFTCRRMERFRHGRVFFAGDAAHQLSPFGARGANSGIQDADNLAWKLALVVQGSAPEALLETYSSERVQAADENILNSTRATDFITPKSAVSKVFRDATLSLAEHYPFARKLVNSGRLSQPTVYANSPLNTADLDGFVGAMIPGAPAADAPVESTRGYGWLLDALGGEFALLYYCGTADQLPRRIIEAITALARDELAIRVIVLTLPGSGLANPEGGEVLCDAEGLAAVRYDLRPGSCYLLRPDQHVCARWRWLDLEHIRKARARAIQASETA